MTVSSDLYKQEFVGDGATTEFAFNIQAHDESWIDGIVDGIVASATVSLNADQESAAGGTVTFDVAPADQSNVTIRRDVPLDQDVEFPDYGAFPARNNEDALDKCMMALAQFFSKITGIFFSELSDTPPSYDGAAGQYLAVNAAEDGVEYLTLPAGNFDPSDSIQFTGACSFDISSSGLWWAGTSNPSAGPAEGVMAVSVISDYALTLIRSSEAVTGSVAQIQTYSDKVIGGSNTQMVAGDSFFTAVVDALGNSRAVIDSPVDTAILSSHPSGSVPEAMASVKYVDDTAAAGFNPAAAQNITGDWDHQAKLTCLDPVAPTEAVNDQYLTAKDYATNTALGATDAKADTNALALSKTHTIRISSSGTGTFLPAGWSVAKIATGQYRVTHTLGTVDYAVQATVNNSTPHFVGITLAVAASFDVLVWDGILSPDDASTWITVVDKS